VNIKELRVQVILTSTSTSRIVVPHVDEPHNNQEEHINGLEVNNEATIEHLQEIVLRRSQIERKSTILDYYVVYQQDS